MTALIIQFTKHGINDNSLRGNIMEVEDSVRHQKLRELFDFAASKKISRLLYRLDNVQLYGDNHAKSTPCRSMGVYNYMHLCNDPCRLFTHNFKMTLTIFNTVNVTFFPRYSNS